MIIAIAALSTALAGLLPPHQERAAQDAAQQARMERAREIYLPSAPHESLRRLVGEWEQEASYASGPGTAVVARGRVTNRSILGGRFVISEGTARQDKGALDVASTLVFGYDGRTRQHTVIVMDTFGTYYVTAAGPKPDTADVITMHGETPEGKGVKRFDVVLRWLDANSYRTEIIFRNDGAEPIPAVTTIHRRIPAAGTPAR